MESLKKEDLVLKGILGDTVYRENKKYFTSWKSEYAENSQGMSWYDFLRVKIAERSSMQDWNVYDETDKLVGKTKAHTEQEAIKKFAPFFKSNTLKARRKSIMRF